MSMQETIKTFADKIYSYRVETGITQEELADLLGLDNSYVSLLERGARIPSLLTLDRIAKVFGVKAYDLLVVDPNDKTSFRQKELKYIVMESKPEVIDKIYAVLKVVDD